MRRIADPGALTPPAPARETKEEETIVTTWKIILLTAGCLALLLALVILAALPGIRLRRVGKALQEILEDPSQTREVPRALNPVAGDLAAVRARLCLQQEEVRQEEKRRQDLIAFLAHDLKTPLTSVLGYLELLRDEPGLSEEQRSKYTGVALAKAKRLEELVGEFFDINTMDLALDRRDEVQISFLLEQLADEFYPLFASKDLTCAPDIEPHLVVEGDGDKLARVFDNVLRNAVSYSSPGGPVGLVRFRCVSRLRRRQVRLTGGSAATGRLGTPEGRSVLLHDPGVSCAVGDVPVIHVRLRPLPCSRGTFEGRPEPPGPAGRPGSPGLPWRTVLP